MPTAPPLDTLLRTMPKVLLHEHLDGGLRPATLFELLHERALASPAADPRSLADWFRSHAHAGSLTEYLSGLAKGRVQLHVPQRGTRREFVAMAEANAAIALQNHLLSRGNRVQMVQVLAYSLHLPGRQLLRPSPNAREENQQMVLELLQPSPAKRNAVDDEVVATYYYEHA